jgi:Polysaccharide lyase family 4, domain II
MKTSLHLLLFFACVGCTRPLQDNTPTPPTSNLPVFSVNFPTGRISGRVVWPGKVPEAKPISGLITTRDGLRWGEMPNHLAPRIDPETKGLAHAVVYLKSIDPKLSKPWPFEPLHIEQRDRTISVTQGLRMGRIGFVRVGEPFEMVSYDNDYHMLRARGAGFFTLPFPEPNTPSTRTIGSTGLTEFTSAAGYFWSSADVFACEHPYYTTTDATGHFTLNGIPPGTYTLVAWHRNWKLLHFERDPETGKIMRLNFDAAFQTERTLEIRDNTPDVILTLPQ